MIGSLRRKFIRISAISIFLVFAGIFLLLFISAKVPMNRLMDELTDTIVANGGSFPEFDPSEQHLPEFINAETQYSTHFFTVWLDDAQQITRINMDSVSAISESEVEEYTQRALDKGRERGWIAEYRYKIAETEDGTSVVFVNGAMTQMTTNRVLFTAFFVLLGSAFLILALTIIFSKRAVQPVAESFEKQKQFITDANHELKTPLTLILSNLDIVESEFGKSEWLDDIRSEGERMGLLINRLVTLSRMDESDARLTYTTFSLSDAVADVVSEFEMLAAERDKTLSADIAPSLRCHGDEGLIRQLIAILLDNAVKYCDPNGSIQVRLYARRHPILIVENTYAEVDTLELDRLFDRFYRADKARTFSGSFGVGLSIARSIVKTHHGTINAYRKAGRIGFRTDLK
ncbi:sensor histidine kinase [Intestinibacillus sp. Marseille-P6563]|uniref:sensor histidine kinase n=1 Tax=Intestinibacillus sp. Marseille-P6563 TaxID=2364792 RepID=UPI000F0534E1|nr:HAMP domain-containing sensor histidine kinase [Intestinibacillus sp. Marseille-P6563]